MERNIVIHCDGGSRGNPGPAAIGAVIRQGSKTKKYGEYLGKKTNNEAEYEALIFSLKKTKQLAGKKKAKMTAVKCFVDSELVVKQLNHEYKLKDQRIQKYFIEIWNLTLDFKQVSFEHVRREKNKEADALVNEALDKQGSKLL